MPTSLWSRPLSGQRPGAVLLGESVLLASCGDEGTAHLWAFDLAGQPLWERAGYRAQLALHRDRFLVVSPQGRFVLLDAAGREQAALPDLGGASPSEDDSSSRLEAKAQEDGRLLLRSGGDLVVSDQALRPLYRLTLPESARSKQGVLVGEEFVCVEGDAVVAHGAGRPTRALLRGLERLSETAMSTWEQQTGQPALAGWSRTAIPLAPERLPELLERSAALPKLGVGERLGIYNWHMAFDPDRGRLFAANLGAPHLVLCLEPTGQPLWCAYLSSACCGAPPIPLEGGLYAASSGCDGTLSWLNAQGEVLFRSERLGAGGLSSALSHYLQPLADGGCVVEGIPGVLAYSPQGLLRWRWPHHFSRLAYSERRDALYGLRRPKKEKGERELMLECVGGLGSALS